jgi:hypothetical protein
MYCECEPCTGKDVVVMYVHYRIFLQKLRKNTEDLKKYSEYPGRESNGNHRARSVLTTRQCYAVLNDYLVIV